MCKDQYNKANILEKENMCIIGNCWNIKLLSNHENDMTLNMLSIHSR